MNTQIRPINQTTFHILYFKYKIYFVSVGALLVAVLLLLYVVIPQIQQWYADQDKTAKIEGKIDVLNKSINTIKSMDDKILQANFQTVTQALPDGKDFAGVLNAISSAAQQSGTSVGDYAFQVGDLSSLKVPKDTFMQINVGLSGNIDHVRQFVTSLRNQFPISRVTEIHLSGDKTSSLIIIFYYKPFPNIAFTGDDVLQPLTDKELNTLSSLRKFSADSFQFSPPDTSKLFQ